MIVYLNGQFLPEEEAFVSINDRGFRYGDAFFDAALIHNRKLFRWPLHAARLANTAAALKMRLPENTERLHEVACELAARNGMSNAVLRTQLSRGSGPRGYAPSGTEQPLLVMSLHPAPTRPLDDAPWKLNVCSLRVAAGDSLARFKTCSRLLQVMAAMEARECGANESLILNTDGFVTEGSSSNLFWIQAGVVCTVPLEAGVLPGTTRAVLIEICAAQNIPHAERMIRPQELLKMEGVFVSFTSRGVVEVDAIDGQQVQRSPVAKRLRDAFEALIERECGPQS